MGSHAILEGTKGGSFFCFFCEVRDKSKDLRIGKIMENHLCSSPFGYLSVVFETFELLPCCLPWDFSCPWQDRSEANLQFFPIRCVETLLRACGHNLCQVPLDAQACDGVHMMVKQVGSPQKINASTIFGCHLTVSSLRSFAAFTFFSDHHIPKKSLKVWFSIPIFHQKDFGCSMIFPHFPSIFQPFFVVPRSTVAQPAPVSHHDVGRGKGL